MTSVKHSATTRISLIITTNDQSNWLMIEFVCGHWPC